jgi:hypothetical protein
MLLRTFLRDNSIFAGRFIKNRRFFQYLEKTKKLFAVAQKNEFCSNRSVWLFSKKHGEEMPYSGRRNHVDGLRGIRTRTTIYQK